MHNGKSCRNLIDIGNHDSTVDHIRIIGAYQLYEIAACMLTATVNTKLSCEAMSAKRSKQGDIYSGCESEAAVILYNTSPTAYKQQQLMRKADLLIIMRRNTRIKNNNAPTVTTRGDQGDVLRSSSSSRPLIATWLHE